MRMLSRGSVLEALENDVDTIVDKQVIAGWRSATRGTVNFGFGLNCPVSIPTLSLLAMAAKWNLIDFSWYPLEMRYPE